MSGNPESRSPSTSLRAGSEVVPFPKRTSGDARAYIDNPLPGAPGSRLVLGANLGDTLPHFQRGVSSSHASRSTALSGIRTVPLGSLGFARDFGSGLRRPLDASPFSCYCRRPYFATVEVFDLFVHCLEDMRRRFELCVYGYVVMPEHVHLLLSEPPRTKLAEAIH